MTKPGARLRALATRLCSGRAMERIVDPAIADLQHEYETATREGQRWRARAALCAGYVAVVKVMAICGLRSLFTDAARTGDGGALRRSAGIALVTGVLFTVIMVLPPLQGTRVPDGVSRVAVFVFLIPQAIPVAIPFAVGLGILYGLRGRAPTRSLVSGVAAIGLVGCVSSLVLVEWVIPDANQAFRETMAGTIGKLTRGPGEVRLSELFARSDPYSAQLFHLRTALCFAAIVFGVLTLALAPFIRRRITAVLTAVSCAVAYVEWAWIVDRTGPGEWISIAVAAWLPNALLMGLGVLVLLLRRQHDVTSGFPSKS
jgi:hypothetical protein